MAEQKLYIPDIESKYDFNEGFFFCCKTLRKRVRKDYDATIAITGDEGIGKSTLANWMGFKTDDDYSLEKNVLYSPSKDGIKDKILGLPRFSTVNGDEAIKILYKLRWYSPLQIFLNTFYRLCRQENKISIFCMPRFTEFNEGFRNHRIMLWVHIIDRGIAVAFMKDWNAFEHDVWHIKENIKMISKHRYGRRVADITLEQKINLYSKTKNFVSLVTFPDLPPDIREEYKKISSEAKYEGLDAEYSHATKYTKLKTKYEVALGDAINILKEEKGWTEGQIAERFQTLSESSVNRFSRKARDNASSPSTI